MPRPDWPVSDCRAGSSEKKRYDDCDSKRVRLPRRQLRKNRSRRASRCIASDCRAGSSEKVRSANAERQLPVTAAQAAQKIMQRCSQAAACSTAAQAAQKIAWHRWTGASVRTAAQAAQKLAARRPVARRSRTAAQAAQKEAGRRAARPALFIRTAAQAAQKTRGRARRPCVPELPRRQLRNRVAAGWPIGHDARTAAQAAQKLDMATTGKKRSRVD